jgi:hypothetical protein
MATASPEKISKQETEKIKQILQVDEISVSQLQPALRVWPMSQSDVKYISSSFNETIKAHIDKYELIEPIKLEFEGVGTMIYSTLTIIQGVSLKFARLVPYKDKRGRARFGLNGASEHGPLL